jgi:hypothetical protein
MDVLLTNASSVDVRDGKEPRLVKVGIPLPQLAPSKVLVRAVAELASFKRTLWPVT